MTDSNIIKSDAKNKHLVEKYSFHTLYDDKHNDIEANKLDIIIAKNDLINEYKEDFNNATKSHMTEKRKSRNITHAEDTVSEITNSSSNKANIPSSQANTSSQKDTVNSDSLLSIEKKISDKIDKSLGIINDLKNSVDNLDTSGLSGDGLSDEEKQVSYKQGFDDGIKQTIENFKSDYEQDRARLSETLKNIVSYVENANKILNSLENELYKASINIAKEVIAKEVESDSGEVALHLAKTLINEIKEAGKISLKVSLYDYDFIVNNFNYPEVEIISDMSVAKGGILILSDVENIDGSISQRLGNIKASLES